MPSWKTKRPPFAAILVAMALTALGQTAADGDDAAVRINPELDFAAADIAAAADTVAMPSYIKLSANHIALNGSDWTALARLAAASDSSRVSIVHIGDSHLQADVATSLVRRRLQADYGDAGRGLVAPLRMAGTNEPRDYAIRATRPSAWAAARLMKRPHALPMGFTGVAVAPKGARATLSVATLSRTGTPQLFDRARLFHNLPPKSLAVLGRGANAISSDTLATSIALAAPTDTLALALAMPSGGALFGISLERSHPGGLLYHVVGNNGAAYVSYNAVEGFATGVALLRPALVIVSLGANEAFSRMTADEMYTSVAVMVERLKAAMPDATLLLTTPMECQRSSYTRRRKGRRRTRTYAVNTRVAGMREAILRYGREQGVATYDFYDVAGASGASSRWVADGLMARDRIHLSAAGYDLQGELLYLALKEMLTLTDSTPQP